MSRVVFFTFQWSLVCSFALGILLISERLLANPCALNALRELAENGSATSRTARLTPSNSEVTANPSELRLIEEAPNRLGPSNLPITNSQSASTLASLSRGQRVEVRYNLDMQSPVTRTMSREEALELLRNDRLENFRIVGAMPSGSTVRLSSAQRGKFADDLFDSLNPRSSSLQTVLVTYRSGEVGTFTGNAQMIRGLAARDEVRAIASGENAPTWISSTFRIGPAARTSVNPLDDYMAQLNAGDVIRTGRQLDYSNARVYHGTIGELETSVRSGPRNVGTGFGGRGLYLARGDEFELAAEYAGHARAGAANRVRNINPNASADSIDTTQVVMRGRLNPERNFRVGVFRVSGDIQRPNLRTGELPTNWDADPRLRALLEREFDVLEIRGASQGTAMSSDRFIVVHERAGPDAIIWEETRRVGPPLPRSPSGQ